jgi:protein involved in polysaccharide export with SLBB domain
MSVQNFKKRNGKYTKPAPLGGVVVLFVLMGLLVSCSGSTPAPSVAGHRMVSNDIKAPSYRLGSGDKIKLNVYGEEDLSGEFEVGGSGAVSLPLVGQVQAGGLTVPEFESRLVEQLKKYVRNPQVNAQVLNYRPFYIQGEIKSGGEYPYSNGLVVRDAVAKAGGYTYRAVTGYVLIRHANETAERQYSLDTPVRVLPGDNIRITERIF